GRQAEPPVRARRRLRTRSRSPQRIGKRRQGLSIPLSPSAGGRDRVVGLETWGKQQDRKPKEKPSPLRQRGKDPHHLDSPPAFDRAVALRRTPEPCQPAVAMPLDPRAERLPVRAGQSRRPSSS